VAGADNRNRLDIARVTTALSGKRRIARRIEHVESIDSTSLELGRRCSTASAHELDGLLLVAEEQTGGRGRRGNDWFSPRSKGLWLTLALRPDLEAERLSLLSVVAAVACVRAVDRLSGPPLGLKWPNDLYCGAGKTGGLLLEMQRDVAGAPLALLGIGINTHCTEGDLPLHLRDRATSLLLEAGRTGSVAPSREDLLVALARELETSLDEAESGSTEDLARLWKERSILLGRTITVTCQGETHRGKVIDLPLPPTLVLETSGTRRVELRGEWAHVHPEAP
jgi:BirA family biotin operon repressor/biotin-[acetyl-CoA-carboxylase] ligase